MVDISTNHRWSRSTKISGKREQNTNQLQSFILICIHMSRKRFFLTFHHLFWDVLLCFLKTYQNFQSLALLCFLLNNDTCFFFRNQVLGSSFIEAPSSRGILVRLDANGNPEVDGNSDLSGASWWIHVDTDIPWLMRLNKLNASSFTHTVVLSKVNMGTLL